MARSWCLRRAFRTRRLTNAATDSRFKDVALRFAQCSYWTRLQLSSGVRRQHRLLDSFVCMNHPLAALGWIVCCFGIAWIGYRRVVWRLGHRRVGRWLGNTVAATGYALGPSGASVLWPSIVEGGSRYVGTDDALCWTWPRAFATAGVMGIIWGAGLTWGRRIETYRYQAAGLWPWLDDADHEMKGLAEAEGDLETCRWLAAKLRAEAARRREPLPRDLEHFVQRYDEQGKVAT